MTRDGLTTIELDVKDENGEMGFVSPHAKLAKQIGAAQGYYDAKHVVNKIHKAGVYLIGRVVVFEDPYLARAEARHGDQAARRRDLDELDRPGLVEPVQREGLGLQRRHRRGGRPCRLRRDHVRLHPLPHGRRPLLRGLPRQGERAQGRDADAVPHVRARAAPSAGRSDLGRRVRAFRRPRPRHRPAPEDAREAARRHLPHGLPVALRRGRARDRRPEREPAADGRAVARRPSASSSRAPTRG